jgi:hypothetical protein
VHTQYLENSKFRRAVNALELIVYELISKIYKNKRYLNFGISNENVGKKRNEGLIC